MKASSSYQKGFARFSGLAAIGLLVTAVFFSGSKVDLSSRWTLERMALSQYGYYSGSRLYFCVGLAVFGVLLVAFVYYLIHLLPKNKAKLFSFFAVLTCVSAFLTGVFPMNTGKIFNFSDPNMYPHFISSILLMSGVPISILVFGATQYKEHKKEKGSFSFFSLAVGAAMLLNFVVCGLVMRNVLLVEVVELVLGAFWIAVVSIRKSSEAWD